MVKIYFDNGQDYLKLCCSLIAKKGQRVHESKKRKWNGVNTVIILAIGHKIPENHTNVETFYKAVKIWELKLIKAVDHKMKNIIVGIIRNSSSFPCINCKAYKDELHTCGEERTVASLGFDYEIFMDQTGGNETLSKVYFCQVKRPPLFETIEEHKECSDKVSDYIVPSSLHLWLGIGNNLVHQLGQIWPETAEAWVKHAKVSAVGYWKGHFLGNALRDLFEDVGFLENGAGNPKIPLMAPYIVAIKSFDSVREGCFGMTLSDDYEARIRRFQNDYNVLVEDFGISTTVKAHDIFHHVPDWIDRH